MTDPSKIAEVVKWRNRHVGRVDVDLNKGWPQLQNELIECFRRLTWGQLAWSGPGEEFEKGVEAAVKNWVTTHVQPIIEDSRDELDRIVQGLKENDPSIDIDVEKIMRDEAIAAGIGDFAGMSTLLVGIAAIVASLLFAITSTTTLLVITTTTVMWPVLVAGLIVGGFLSIFGAIKISEVARDDHSSRSCERDTQDQTGNPWARSEECERAIVAREIAGLDHQNVRLDL